MNQTVQKMINPLLIPWVRFPIACIMTLLPPFYVPFSRFSHVGDVPVGIPVYLAMLTLAVYPIYFLNLTFVFCREAGRPMDRLKQGIFYGFYLLWPFLGYYSLPHLGDFLFPVYILIEFLPLMMMFVLPFWKNPNAANPWRFAGKTFLRALIALAFGFLAALILNFIFGSYDLALRPMRSFEILDSFMMVIGLLTLFPLIFLAIAPSPARIIEGNSGENPN